VELSPREALVLGAVQGLTEFLPVSSTAHLVLVPRFLGWQTPGLVFDTSLHLGTLLAMGAYFRTDWQFMAQGVGQWLRTGTLNPGAQQALTLVAANVPAGLAGFLGERWIERLRTPPAIALGMVAGALALGMADRSQERGRSPATFSDFLWLGLAQAVALMPGVSRSGITISTGLSLGLARPEAARASFLLGLPVIAASGLYKLKDLADLPRDRRTLVYFTTGCVAAALSGYGAMHLFTRFLRQHSLWGFVAYRLLIGSALLFPIRQVSHGNGGQTT
jgi:undecaprenyl-diphosphatase